MIKEREKRRPLTDVQKSVLTALVNYIEENRFQPSMADLARIVGISAAGVYNHFQSIALAGWVELTGAPRSIIVPPDVMEEMGG